MFEYRNVICFQAS